MLAAHLLDRLFPALALLEQLRDDGHASNIEKACPAEGNTSERVTPVQAALTSCSSRDN